MPKAAVNKKEMFESMPVPKALLSMAVILLFMLLTGGSPSVVRAGIMHLLMQLMYLLSQLR